jgi:hypothetical protein
MSSLEVIQVMISPVFMVSGCAILLSISSSKSSAVIDRIRDLSSDKRDYDSRFLQIELLFNRLMQIRNAVYSFEIAIVFFLVTSLLIGATHFLGNRDSITLILSFFLLGMASVLTGVVFLGMESTKAFQITREFLVRGLDERNEVSKLKRKI